MIGMDVQLDWRGDEAKAAVDAALDSGAQGMAVVLQSDIANSMPGAGSAKIGLRKFTPSLPGEPPGVRTGNLRGSIQTGKEGNGVRRVGTKTGYGPVHEFGSARHPKRPFMLPKIRSKATQRRMVKQFIKAATATLDRAMGVSR